MPTFDVVFQLVVAGLGTRVVTTNNIVATDAAAAIALAHANLVQVVPIGVTRTAP